MKELAARTAKLWDELSSADEVIVRGILGAVGAGAASAPDNPIWTMSFELVAWRVGNGPVHRQELRIQQRLVESEFRKALKTLRRYECVALRLRLSEESVFGSAQGLLTQLIGKDSDRELKAIAKDLQQPVIVTDPWFGKFTLDRAVDWYEAKTRWGREETSLTLKCEPADASFPIKTLKHAQRLWTEQREWDSRVRERIVESLLSLKNDTWLHEGEKPFNPEAFLSRIRMYSIGVEPDGSFDFWFRDGGLFWGHDIAVRGSFDEGLGGASIQG